MGLKCFLRSILFFLVVLISISLSGCDWEKSVLIRKVELRNFPNNLFANKSHSGIVSAEGQQEESFRIDPLFLEFYNALGGADILGQAISGAEKSDGRIKQYLENASMVFDPQSVDSERFQLEPLGLELNILEAQDVGSAEKEGRIVNGKLVISEFLDIYERIGGARFVGKPLTEARYNADKGRIEQYFENLGFYKLDVESRIRLMPYGAYICDSECRYREVSAAIPAKQPILPDPFLMKTLELGLEFVGKPLTGLHYASDGMQEVIFENLVLAADPENPGEVRARPLTEKIGNHVQDLVSPQDSPLSEFIEIEGGKGFNVPIFFIDYLEKFGGMQISGLPISEVFSPEVGVYWQCFANLCLQFDLNTDNDQRLRPVPLGAEYKAKVYDKIKDFSANQSMEKVDLKVWEKGTFVSAEESQEIHVALYENGIPLKNCEPILIITMPDGSQRKTYFQPSSENGRTSLSLPAIKAPNGTLIAYQICLIDLDGEEHCVGDNYLIWNSD